MGTYNLPSFMFKRSLINYLTGFCISTTVEVWGSWDCIISENNLPISCSFCWILHSLFTSSCSSFTQLIDIAHFLLKSSDSLVNLRPVSYIYQRKVWLAGGLWHGRCSDSSSCGEMSSATCQNHTWESRQDRRWKGLFVTSFTSCWVCSLPLLVDKRGSRLLTDSPVRKEYNLHYL